MSDPPRDRVWWHGAGPRRGPGEPTERAPHRETADPPGSRLIRWLARWVPAPRRDEWLAEWHAELSYAREGARSRGESKTTTTRRL